MTEQRYVSYFRVSTDKQGASGLGLDAQRTAVAQFLNGKGATVITEFVEVESGSKNDRPQLKEALEACKMHDAALIIARLDRLGRNVAFVATLMESSIAFVACDNPHASRFMLHLLAAFAEHERELIRERTRAALAAAKARGIKLGLNGIKLAAENHRQAVIYASTIAEHVNAARASGAKTLTAIAAYLNNKGVPSRQNRRWHAHSIARVVRRMESKQLHFDAQHGELVNL